MSPRLDGMPERHPEKQPVRLATLTLYGSGDPTGADFMAWGELTVNGVFEADEVEHVQTTVRGMLRKVLEQDPTVLEVECRCGRCGTEGGDPS